MHLTSEIARGGHGVTDFEEFPRVVAVREAEARSHLATSPDVLATAPFFDTDIFDLSGLLRLGGAVWGE